MGDTRANSPKWRVPGMGHAPYITLAKGNAARMSSYVRQTLAHGEEIVEVARFNWTYHVPAVFWCLLGNSTLAYGLYLKFEGRLPGDPLWVLGLALVPAVLGLLLLFAHIIHVKTTEIAVTSSRFVYKTGLISRTTKEVSLNKIEEINLRQSILGRIFGHGNLILRGTGVGVIELPEIDNPITFRRSIQGARADMRNGDNENGNESPSAEQPAVAPQESTSALAQRAGRPFRAESLTAPADRRKRGKPARRRKDKRRGKSRDGAPPLPDELR